MKLLPTVLLIFRIFSVLLILLMGTFAVNVKTVAAASLTLQEIGASTVGGRHISSWTYMGSNPILTGTADPDAVVAISIDGTATTATADSTGNWSYTPTTLTGEGTFQITITSGDQTISFTLALSPYSGGGSTASDSGVSKGGVTTDELPLSGGLADTLKLVGLGIGLVAMGFMSWWIIREFARGYVS